MQEKDPRTVTRLLQDWRSGDQTALDEIFPLVYNELHRRARSFMGRESPGNVLQATALINEVYLRLVNTRQLNWESRSDFFAVCANLMRQILVDLGRLQAASKNGGGLKRVSLVEALAVSNPRSVDLIDLDDALRSLEQLNPRQSRVVELRHFGGLSMEETAEVLGVSPETVKRDWRIAKAWLLHELSRGKNDDANTI